MPSKKFRKNRNKTSKQSKKSKRYRSHRQNYDERTSARLAIENLTSNASGHPLLPGLAEGCETPKSSQAFTVTPSQDGSSWHNPLNPYQNLPASQIFRPANETNAANSYSRIVEVAEHEVDNFGSLAPMMAPGHDQQQQRNQQPPPHRQHVNQGATPQRSIVNQNGPSVNGEQQQRSQSARDRDTERDQPQRRSNGASSNIGPTTSHIQVAKPYVFQQAIEGCLRDIGVAQAREDNIRLAGVRWIDDVRRALKLPVRTFDTAVIYYHKFRLVHSDGEYSYVDAAAAALFAACKIEDTLKKSRDILCAAHNIKVPREQHLSPDDSTFEHSSRSIIGLERLMLEASSFDFRNRHPQTLMIKLAKHYRLGSPSPSTLVKTAYTISLDLYRTFAPLKQSTATLAFACLELAIRLHTETESQNEGIQAIIHGDEYRRWGISRAEVMETLLDLLELYTHYRSHTTVGSEFPLDSFLEVRIPLNEELSRAGLPRFTEYIDTGRSGADPAGYAATVNGVSAAATAANGIVPGKDDKSPTSPRNATSSKANGIRQKAGERGREGTVRFILNPDRERQERMVVAEYHPQPTPTSQTPNQPQRPSQSPSRSHSHSQSQSQSQRGSQLPPHTPSHPRPHPHHASNYSRDHPPPGPRSGPRGGPGPGTSHGRGNSHGPRGGPPDRDDGPGSRAGAGAGSGSGPRYGGDSEGRPPRRP